MKKIALFSDIHGNKEALDVILSDIKKDKFDDIICLGDVISIGPSSNACLDEIRNSNIKMLLGNHEYYILMSEEELNKKLNEEAMAHEKYIQESLSKENIEYIKKSAIKYEFVEHGKLFTFSHFFLKEGYPFFPVTCVAIDNLKSTIEKYEGDYFFFGHEHRSFEATDSEKNLYCIGSSGCNNGNITFYTTIEIDKNIVKVKKNYLKYDREKFEKSIIDKNYPERNNNAKILFGIYQELPPLIKEKSCGAVVYKKDISELKFLIIKQEKGHFTFPKGHVEKDETEEETAIREIKEETGIDVILDKDFRKVSTYFPEPNIIKDVIFFVAESKSGFEIPQKTEVEKIMWLDLHEAIAILTYNRDKEILNDAYNYLESKIETI